MHPILLTSFAPWRAHQHSNTSDDLIALLASRNRLPKGTVLMRHLPVHFQLAPCTVKAAIAKNRPAVVVCCGMAEKRSLLTLERYGHGKGERLETRLDLTALRSDTHWTTISHDAGRYVCNALYYQVLSYLASSDAATQGLFIHVPLLTDYNRELIVRDFAVILSRIRKIATLQSYALA